MASEIPDTDNAGASCALVLNVSTEAIVERRCNPKDGKGRRLPRPGGLKGRAGLQESTGDPVLVDGTLDASSAGLGRTLVEAFLSTFFGECDDERCAPRRLSGEAGEPGLFVRDQRS